MRPKISQIGVRLAFSSAVLSFWGTVAALVRRSLGAVAGLLGRRPRLSLSLLDLTLKYKFSRYILTGAEVVLGRDPSFQPEMSEVICIGDCTRVLASKNGYRHIPGCPPTLKQLAENL